MSLLDAPEPNDALNALDRALVDAVRARTAAGPRARLDDAAIALRSLLADGVCAIEIKSASPAPSQNDCVSRP